MMSLRALIVGFAFVSFVQDSFEAVSSVHASRDLKAAGRVRAICESLCRSKREDRPQFREEISFDACFRECIHSERRAVENPSSLEMMDLLRTRRNANQEYSEDDCHNPSKYVEHAPVKPDPIRVDYSRNKPDLLIEWSPVRTIENYNWTSYVFHYVGGDKKEGKNNYCKFIPKEQNKLILRDGDGWNYPDYIWVAIFTYPHGIKDIFEMEEFGPTPRPPPSFPTKSNDAPTKLIAASLGAVFGLILISVFAILAYRKKIYLCKQGRDQRDVFVHPRINNPCVPLTVDVDEHRTMSPKINNDFQFTALEKNTSDPKKNMSGPDTFYACYFAESQWFQVQVASVVNYFRQNGYAVEMDVMNSSERIDLGPTRWAEQQIKKARNVLVFLSPGLLRLCGGDGEETDSSHQEHDRLWYELDLLRKIYAQTHSARKMVCIILPNMNIDPGDLPLWAEMRYRWPEDEMNILKRLNDRPIIQPW
ncbi:uncharacterized protein LOC144633268 isoform X1 [Oculina patagonica]